MREDRFKVSRTVSLWMLKESKKQNRKDLEERGKGECR